MSPPRTHFYRTIVVRRLMLLVLVVLPLALLSAACGSSTTAPPTAPTSTPPPQGPADMVITDLVVGDGDELQTGLQGTFIYSVWNYDPAGTDSKGSLVQSASIQFRPGVTGLIEGVTTGVIGMKVHGKRRLIIPPSLAYGSAGSADGRIPPNGWVVFEFELLEVRDCAVTSCQT